MEEKRENSHQKKLRMRQTGISVDGKETCEEAAN